MHIGFITTEYALSPIDGGGIGTFLKNLSFMLKDCGLNVTIIYWGNKLKQTIYDENIPIIPVMQPYSGKFSFFQNRIYLNKIVNKIVIERRIDILETIDWEGIIAFCKFEVPIVTRLHGSNIYFNYLLNRKNGILIKWLEKDAIRRSIAYIGVSLQSLEITKKLFKISVLKRSEVIYNPINNKFVGQFYNPTISDVPTTIVYYGTITYKKGVLNIPTIFNAINKKYPNINLVVVGRDTFNSEGVSLWSTIVEKFSKSAIEKVKYLGCLSYEELLRIVSEADICLLPSYAETFGLVLLEAMLLGRPTVSSNILCFQEIATHNVDVFQCNPDDTNSFINSLCLLIEEKELRQKMSKQAYSTALRKFDNETIVQKNIDFYKSLI